MRSLVLSALFLVPVVASAVTPADELKLDFGDKEKGKPKSPEAGQITASGTVSVPKRLTDPKVVMLVRLKGTMGDKVHTGKMANGKWTAAVEKLPPGTYLVRVRVEADRPEGGGQELPLPALDKDPIEVEVKGK